MSGVGGDPSGCSQLGAELRTRAAALLALRDDLVVDGPAAARHTRAGGAPPQALRVDRDALDRVADRLDAAGAALQRFAQELARLAEEHRRLDDDVHRSGLALDDLRVVEPWGVAASQVASDRLAAMPALQKRAERLSGARARAHGALQRSLAEATRGRDHAASTRRATLGGGDSGTSR